MNLRPSRMTCWRRMLIDLSVKTGAPMLPELVAYVKKSTDHNFNFKLLNFKLEFVIIQGSLCIIYPPVRGLNSLRGGL